LKKLDKIQEVCSKLEFKEETKVEAQIKEQVDAIQNIHFMNQQTQVDFDFEEINENAYQEVECVPTLKKNKREIDKILKTSSEAIYKILIWLLEDTKVAKEICSLVDKEYHKDSLEPILKQLKMYDLDCEKYFYENRKLKTREDYIRLFEFMLPILIYCGEARKTIQDLDDEILKRLDPLSFL